MPLDASTAITVSFGGNSFSIWDEGCRFTVNRDGKLSRGSVHWRCRWTDASSIAALMLGGSQNAGGTTLYNNAAIFPRMGGMTAQAVEIVGDGILSQGSDGFVAYERAELVAHFGFPEYAAGSSANNVGELEIDYATHAVPLDPLQPTWYWDSGHTQPIAGFSYPSMTITTYDFTIALYNRASLNIAAFLPYANTVNSNPMASQFGLAGKGQILFRGPRSRMKMTAGQAPNFDIMLSFGYHPIADGWNSLPKPGSSTLWVNKYNFGGQPEFAYKDLNLLLTSF